MTIIAGTDTAATTLTTTIYYLLQNPAVYEELKAEVDREFPKGEEPLDTQRLSQMNWLNGCM